MATVITNSSISNTSVYSGIGTTATNIDGGSSSDVATAVVDGGTSSTTSVNAVDGGTSSN